MSIANDTFVCRFSALFLLFSTVHFELPWLVKVCQMRPSNWLLLSPESFSFSESYIFFLEFFALIDIKNLLQLTCFPLFMVAEVLESFATILRFFYLTLCWLKIYALQTRLFFICLSIGEIGCIQSRKKKWSFFIVTYFLAQQQSFPWWKCQTAVDICQLSVLI